MNALLGFVKQAWLVLVLAAALGGALAMVDRSLQERIQRNAQQRLQKAVLEVVPTGVTSQEDTLAGHPLYRVCGAGGELVGWAVPAETMGFQDRIRLLVGLSADGQTIQGLAILDSRETPGLGEKIRESSFRAQFADQPSHAQFQVTKPGETAPYPIDAITGATISTAAVTGSVNDVLTWVRDAMAVHAPTEAEASNDD